MMDENVFFLLLPLALEVEPCFHGSTSSVKGSNRKKTFSPIMFFILYRKVLKLSKLQFKAGLTQYKADFQQVPLAAALEVALIQSCHRTLDPGGFRVHADPDVSDGLQTVTERTLQSFI
jgi:hypothetical protein